MAKNKDILSALNAVDDNKSVVHDFRLRSSVIGYESYRPCEYRLYFKLADDEKVLHKLDDHLVNLFNGEVDDGNADMLDDVLFSTLREAMCDLENQRCEHMDIIRRLSVRHKADYTDIKMMLEARLDEYEQLKEKLEVLYKIKEVIQHEKSDQ